MGPIELEFDYVPGAQSATEWHPQAAFGVVLELALQAAQQAGSVHGLRELCFGAELVLDRARRCIASCDPQSGRLEVTSTELELQHGHEHEHGHSTGEASVHLTARLELSRGLDAPPDLGALELGATDPLPDAFAHYVRSDRAQRAYPLVTGLSLHERGLQAELSVELTDCSAYAVHPLVVACACGLARFWLDHEPGRQLKAPLRALRFELLEAQAEVTRLRVLRGAAANGATVELSVIAESPRGLAWRLIGLELELQSEREAAANEGSQHAISASAGPRGSLLEVLRALPESARRARCASFLRQLVAGLVGVPADELAQSRPLRDLGLSSRAAVELASTLAVALDRPLAPSFVFDHPTLDRLIAAVSAFASPAAATTLPSRSLRSEPAVDASIAVIGMACRFPGGASSPESAWQLLCTGRDPVGAVPPERVALAPNMARHALPAAFLTGIESFDAAFFAIGEREAAAMDPQHRMLLELTWEALERAGIVPSTLAGSRTGVFVSAAPFGYSQLVDEVDAFTVLGNEPSAAAGRLSYFLALSGPSMCVDAACASSLVAACLACDSLRRGEVDLAIVGGANLLLEPLVTEGLLAAGVLSSTTRRCRAFDAGADGYVRGEAGGVLVLRRAADAARAGEPVQALLRGHAVAHGGRANGLGAPSREAQVEVIQRALAHAGVEPHEVDYVEAHGTGTAVGDAVELQAFAQTYGAASARQQALRIGSIKTNIGHAELAAGVASLIKAVLMLQRGELTPHLHFRRPALGFDWASAGIAVAERREPWPSERARRLASVNALGMSGTYAHVLLESAPVVDVEPALALAEAAAGPSSPYVVALQAGSEAALRELASAYADYLRAGGAPERLATTSQSHRERLAIRAAVIAADAQQLQAELRALASDENARSPAALAPLKVAFLYSGLGGQHAGMGAALFERCEVFRDAIADCERLIASRLPCSLFDVMRADANAEQLLARAAVSQPATFAIQHALTQLWRSWGVKPDVVMGHSLGELAAAQAAGILSLEDALWLAAERGRLMDTLPPGGAMAAVDAPRELVEALLAEFPGALWLAAVNAPNQLVISGLSTAIDGASARLQARGFRARRLPIPVAAHSGLLAPMLDEFEQAAQRVSYGPASLPIVSTRTGTRLGHELGSARYFREQLRAPVEFARGMQALLEEGAGAFLEIGPSAALLGPAAACVEQPDKLFAASLSRDRDPLRQMLDAALELHAAGLDLDWRAMPIARGAHDPAVPTYAFQRRRYWVRTKPAALAASDAAAPAESEPVPSSAQASGAERPRLLRFPEDEALARLERMIKDELRKVLVADAAAGDLEGTFGELGLGSLGAVQLRSCVQRWLGKALPPSIVHAETTARELAREAWSYAMRAA